MIIYGANFFPEPDLKSKLYRRYVGMGKDSTYRVQYYRVQLIGCRHADQKVARSIPGWGTCPNRTVIGIRWES